MVTSERIRSGNGSSTSHSSSLSRESNRRRRSFVLRVPSTRNVHQLRSANAVASIQVPTRPALRFEPYERSAGWFGTMDNRRYRVSLTATWKVTNTSKRSVVLKDFYMNGLATEYHILFVDGSQDAFYSSKKAASILRYFVWSGKH